MEPEPTGRVLRTGDRSYQLILTRGFPVPPAEIWSALTDPVQAAAWFGRWEGHPHRTRMDFIQHLTDPAAAGSYGPGWEYYLDRLKAALNGTPAPEFEDYYPAQGPYFEEQAQAALGTGDAD